MQDPQIGRWHVIDPQSERYFSQTTYSYVANNPLYFIDPTGEYIIINGKEKIKTEDGKEKTIDHNVMYENGRHIIIHKIMRVILQNCLNTLVKIALLITP
ncbi:MAG: hypothetical protein IPO01_17160 [Chitinophagaceae bacterium]|nr:hypothetical protein [Chitinophagaceae bacterium]